MELLNPSSVESTLGTPVINDTLQIPLTNTDAAIECTVKQHTLNIWIDTRTIKTYTFDIAYFPGGSPYFPEKKTLVVINKGYELDYMFVSGVDPDGDSLTYSFTNPISGQMDAFLIDNTIPEVRFENIDASLSGTHSGFILDLSDGGSRPCDSEMAFSVLFNNLPASQITTTSFTVTSHTTEPLQLECPMFTDSEGDFITVTYTSTLSELYVNVTDCKIYWSS